VALRRWVGCRGPVVWIGLGAGEGDGGSVVWIGCGAGEGKFDNKCYRRGVIALLPLVKIIYSR
jgi:hypothetical protein